MLAPPPISDATGFSYNWRSSGPCTASSRPCPVWKKWWRPRESTANAHWRRLALSAQR